MYERGKQYLLCNVAGFSHWDGLEVFSQLEPGVELTLVPEPDNPYDPNAVAFYLAGVKIGYVPRDSNSTISLLLNFGHADVFRARIAAVYKDKHPEQQVLVSINVTDAREE